MNRLIFYLWIIILFPGLAIAQGFDWQYSARLPFETPNCFFGIDAGVEYNLYYGDFNFCQDIENSGEIVCGSFESGNGIGFHAGVKTEYWFKPDYTFFGSVLFNYSPGIFTSEYFPPYPPEYGKIRLENEYRSSFSQLLTEIGLKYRIPSSHFFVAASIKFGYIISENHEFKRTYIDGSNFIVEEPYIYQNVKIKDIVKAVLYPDLKLGYDLNMGLGSYSSVYIGIGLPLQNRVETGSWNNWKASAGVSFYPFGIK